MPPKAASVAVRANTSSKTSAGHKNQQRKKQPVPLEERLKRLFTSLCAQIEGGHFTNAIKTCNKILRLHPADKDAQQTKLFLLLQTEQYDAALSLIADVTSGHDLDYTFEEAYAMYRLQKEEEAATALRKIKGTEKDHRGVLHLEAQLAYRQGSYQSGLELYNELLETADPQSEEYSDVLTNLTASQKHLDFINTGFLHALDALPASIASTIETSPPPSVQSTTSLASASAAVIQQSPEDSAVANKVKKVRMKRVPKGVTPGVTPPPDPERWLKKSERSSFGQTGKKRRGGGGATQGVILENAPAQSHSGKSSGGGASHGKGKKKRLPTLPHVNGFSLAKKSAYLPSVGLSRPLGHKHNSNPGSADIMPSYKHVVPRDRTFSTAFIIIMHSSSPAHAYKQSSRLVRNARTLKASRFCLPCAWHAISATLFSIIMTDVLGVLVIARNGDRYHFYQDPTNYEPAFTESTPLGASESFQLGSFLRSVYLTSSSPSYINGMNADLVDTHELHVHAKAGGEGPVIFDSAIALLQGLFPPNPKNKITLANETTITAPLGGYQYVPIETVEPGNDRSLEPWTDCPAFEQHISDVYASSEFKSTAKAAQPFFGAVRDYVFGRPTTLENAWNIYDYMSTELIHNKTYAHRLPPTLIEQARGFANFHENAIFSDKDLGGIGNLAGRTILHSVLSTLQRLAFNGDPLQFLLIETSYQPFISLFHMLEMVKENPDLAGIPNYASALAFELRRGPPPEDRDFVRIKFKNGTNDNFQTYHAFGHKADIPVTEFIYRIENYAITSQKQWAAACSAGFDDSYLHIGSQTGATSTVFAACAAILFVGVFTLAKYIKRSRAAKKQYIRLGDDEAHVAAQQAAPMTEKGRLPL